MRDKVIAATAKMLAEELLEDMVGSFRSLYIIPLALAQQMTGLSRNTLRGLLPVVEMTKGKHGIRLSDLQALVEKRTKKPGNI